MGDHDADRHQTAQSVECRRVSERVVLLAVRFADCLGQGMPDTFAKKVTHRPFAGAISYGRHIGERRFVASG
jgi:hypothetical protein